MRNVQEPNFTRRLARDVARLWLAGFIVLLLVAGTCGRAMSREPAWSSALLFCDLVVQGTVANISIRSERLADAMPMEVGSPDMTIDVAEVTLNIVEVFKGDAPESTITFIAHISTSGYRNNYQIGAETVVGLVWGGEVLGGMYWLYSDDARFVRTAGGWQQQRGDMVLLEDVIDIRNVMLPVAPRRVLSDENLVLVGQLAHVSFVDQHDTNDNLYVLKRIRLVDVRSLTGTTAAQEMTVDVVVSGDFWPEWREVSSFPQALTVGRHYCVAVRDTPDGFVIPQGRDGIFEVEGQTLLSVTGKSVGLSLDDVAATGGERH